MKQKFFTWFTAMVLAVAIQARVKVGNNPNIIDLNAILEMESTNKAMLLPRMTASKRDAIVNPLFRARLFITQIHPVKHLNVASKTNAQGASAIYDYLNQQFPGPGPNNKNNIPSS